MAGMNQEEKDMARFIIDLNREWKITVVMIEHVGVVMDISKRIAVLDFGEKIAEGTPDEVIKNRGTAGLLEMRVNDTYYSALYKSNATSYPKDIALREKKFGVWKTKDWQKRLEEIENITLGLHAKGIIGKTIAILGNNTPDGRSQKLQCSSRQYPFRYLF